MLRLPFEFTTKEQSRRTLVHISDAFRNLNFAATDSDDYKRILAEIDAFIADRGASVAAEFLEDAEEEIEATA